MLNEILKLLENNNLFITGGAGVGKSFLTKQIIKYYKDKNKNIISLGSTGISAVGIGGVTLHSFFRIGICKNHEDLAILDIKQRKKKEELKQILKNVDLIVIDEISMVAVEVMELIYFRLINSEFCGKIIVVGDFYQLAPITNDDGNLLFKLKYAFDSYAWEQLNFVCVELTKSKRQNDLEFCEILSKIRLGNVTKKEILYLEKLKNNQFSQDATTLFGRNYEADKLNLQKLSQINSKLYVFEGVKEIYDEKLSEDKFYKWYKNLNVPEKLFFKIGAKIIFTINKNGYFYNGEQGVIIGFDDEDVIVRKNDDSLIKVSLNSYNCTENILTEDGVKQKILASFFQFPFRLSYAITIHKSQGMGIENLVCDLNHIFAKGQFYVAISRGINPQNLKILYNRKEDLQSYISNSIRTDDRVNDFYKSIKIIKF